MLRLACDTIISLLYYHFACETTITLQYFYYHEVLPGLEINILRQWTTGPPAW